MKVGKGMGVHELGVRDLPDDGGRGVRDVADEGGPIDGAGLDRATQARIGDQLRAMYAELMEQPVPDRFRELLARLDGDDERAGRDDDTENPR